MLISNVNNLEVNKLHGLILLQNKRYSKKNDEVEPPRKEFSSV
jgi:hypothetical protein